MKLPAQLGRAPVTMAVVELRFEMNLPFELRAAHLWEVLVRIGAIDFQQVDDSVAIPLVAIKEVADLHHRALYECKVGSCRVRFGPRVIDVFSPIAYPGWSVFYRGVEEIVRGLCESSSIDRIGQIGVRYENKIPARWSKCLRLEVALAGQSALDEWQSSRFVRTNKHSLSMLNLSTIVDGVVNETIIDIDVIASDLSLPLDRDEILALIGELHSVEKQDFFSLISEHALMQMEPKYDS